jgi:hypothetical protein
MGAQIADVAVGMVRRSLLTREEKATQRKRGTSGGACPMDRSRGRWTIMRGRRPTLPESGAQRQAAAEIAPPVFGHKNNARIDRGQGFTRRFTGTSEVKRGTAGAAQWLSCPGRESGGLAGSWWADVQSHGARKPLLASLAQGAAGSSTR